AATTTAPAEQTKPAPVPSSPPEASTGSAKPSSEPVATLRPASDAPELLKMVQARWEQIIARVAERSRGGAEVLRDARPVRMEGENTVVLQFHKEFPYSQMQSDKRRQFVEQTISRILGGREIILRCELLRANTAPSNQHADGAEQDVEEINGEQYAREVAQTFNGYIELEGG
ncbi:MAG: hypothetical protein ACK44M_15300, partial [Chloroflexus sp.]